MEKKIPPLSGEYELNFVVSNDVILMAAYNVL